VEASVTESHMKTLLNEMWDKIYSFPLRFRDGVTSFDEKIFVIERMFYHGIPNMAALLVTVLHELSHLKRLRYVADGNYFNNSPEKEYPKDVKEREIGNYFEREIFGNLVNTTDLSEDCSNFILNIQNWDNKNILKLSQKFKSSVKDRESARFKCFRPARDTI